MREPIEPINQDRKARNQSCIYYLEEIAIINIFILINFKDLY